MRRIAAGLILAGLLTASAAAAPGQRASAWRVHSALDRSFTLATPPSWLDTFQITPELIARRKLPPMIKSMVTKISTSPTFKLAAYDLTPGKVTKQFATNVNVTEYREPGGTTVQEFAAATLGQLAATKLVTGKPQSSLVRLPAGLAYKLTFHLRLGILTSSTQYGFVHGGVAYAVSYTTTRNQGASYQPTFTRSIRSFRFTY
jgi:hypothetical protein